MAITPNVKIIFKASGRRDLGQANMIMKNLEIRTCNKSLTQAPPHRTAEIVKRHEDGETCHTIAYWKEHKNGFDLVFVGSRPFDDIDSNVFFNLAKFGQGYLTECFEGVK